MPVRLAFIISLYHKSRFLRGSLDLQRRKKAGRNFPVRVRLDLLHGSFETALFGILKAIP